jgi:hypothetical protein
MKNLPTFNFERTTLNVSQENLDIDKNIYLENDIIIIQSGTGTSKTRNTAKNLKDILNEEIYVLSVVNLISLAREQIDCFQNNYKINMNNYQYGIQEFNNKNGVICINSLHKLSNIEYNVSNKILYIDEVNDLIETLYKNECLDGILVSVYTFLLKLIKEAKKVILTDANIDNNVLNLLSIRKTNNKTIFIKNSYQKFKDVEATLYNDENKFIDKLRVSIKNKKYFLFGCDSCSQLRKMYISLCEEFEEQKKDFILITSLDKFDIHSASRDFKNKFVFYSPSVKTGVSFYLKDVKQEQFIYISKKPQIKPDAVYQMSCRTRNMKCLNLYISDINTIATKYETLEEYENAYKKMIDTNERLMNLSVSRDEDDNIRIVNNMYFKLFTFSKYKEDIFYTDYKEHYLNYLKRDGFKIVESGFKAKIDKKIDAKMNQQFINYYDKKYNDILKLYYEAETEEDIDKLYEQHLIITKRMDMLNISTKEKAIKYKDFVLDEYLLTDYFRLINLFKTKEYINKKILEKQNKKFNVKCISDVFQKIRMLEIFEAHYKIADRFSDLNYKNVDINNEINEDFKTMYKSNFPKHTTKNFKSKENLRKVYINIINDITGSQLKFITYKKVKNKETKQAEWVYFFNSEMLKYIFELVKEANPTLKSYNLQLVENLTGFKPDKIPLRKDDIDEDLRLETYNYNKTIKLVSNINTCKTLTINEINPLDFQ